MMRRNSTSRLVQTLSPDSTRPDEIAATDMALSRGVWSRDDVSDMRMEAHIRQTAHDAPHSVKSYPGVWPFGTAKSIAAAVTGRRRGARPGQVKSILPSRSGGNMAI